MKIRWRNIVLVAGRELREIVGTKGFLVMLFMPLMILILMSLLFPLANKITHQAQQNRTQSVRIGVIGADLGLVDAWREDLQDHKLFNGLPLFNFQSILLIGVPQETLIKNARKKVRDNELDAYVVLRGDIRENGSCDFYAQRGFDMQLPNDLSQGLRNTVRNERLRAEGLNPTRITFLTRGVSWNAFELTAEPETSDQTGGAHRSDFGKLFAPALVCVMMMFFLTFTTSQRLLRGIVEEKNSRVIEVLLSSLSPSEILTGKVLGFYIIGLIQFAVWVGVGMIFMKWKAIPITDYIPPLYFLQFLVFLTTGYLFYASIFAAIGAIAGDENDSQQIQGIITLFIVIPLMFNFVIITQPNWWPVRLISYFPFLSPTVMAIRLIVTPIPWWEFVLIALITVGCAGIGIQLAAKIFRIGILMTGKRPSLKEVVRWCFYREESGVVES